MTKKTNQSGSDRDFKKEIEDIASESRRVTSDFFDSNLENLMNVGEVLSECIRNSGKLLIFGNGGSAADADHFAGELVNRFEREREGYPALSLGTSSSVITSVANDSDYSLIFARQIEALGEKGDTAIGITTSGRSPNVIKGIDTAGAQGLTTVALLGSNGNPLEQKADYRFMVPSTSTPRIQEVHIKIIHTLCFLIEERLVHSR